MDFFKIRTEDIGTGTPFIARLSFTILDLRDRVYFDNHGKQHFDDIYGLFYEHAKLAYYSNKELLKTHMEYMFDVKTGKVVTISDNTLQIEKVIDSEIRRLFYSILSEAEIAYKGLINEYPKLFEGFQLGFMAKKDSIFRSELLNIQKEDSALADYLILNREKWTGKLTSLRNKKEHGGWNLPEYDFIFRNGEIEIIVPQIDGISYLDYIQFLLASLFTFAEEIIVYTLSKNLPFEYVYEIPKEKRREELTCRFGINIANKGDESWTLEYKGPDMDLLK